MAILGSSFEILRIRKISHLLFVNEKQKLLLRILLIVILAINSTAAFNITVFAVEKLVKIKMNALPSTPIVACIEIIFPLWTRIHASIIALVIPSISFTVTSGTMIYAEIFALYLKHFFKR